MIGDEYESENEVNTNPGVLDNKEKNISLDTGVSMSTLTSLDNGTYELTVDKNGKVTLKQVYCIKTFANANKNIIKTGDKKGFFDNEELKKSRIIQNIKYAIRNSDNILKGKDSKIPLPSSPISELQNNLANLTKGLRRSDKKIEKISLFVDFTHLIENRNCIFSKSVTCKNAHYDYDSIGSVTDIERVFIKLISLSNAIKNITPFLITKLGPLEQVTLLFYLVLDASQDPKSNGGKTKKNRGKTKK